jgi:hypothetical protein
MLFVCARKNPMSIEQPNIDIMDLARRIAFMLECEERKLFGRNLGGSVEDLVDRLLAAGGDVDPKVYKLAFTLRAGR